MRKFCIDGIHFDIPLGLEEIQDLFNSLLKDSYSECVEKTIINFVNPEIFLLAKKNHKLYKHLVNAKYNFIDGIGLLWLINNELGTNFSVSDRYTGTDFFDYLKKMI